MPKRPALYSNLISYIGLAAAMVAFVIGVVLLIANALLPKANPYTSLVTYMIIPMAIGGGIILAVIGMVLELHRRRRQKTAARILPVLDLNHPKTRKRLLLLALFLAFFFTVSSVATYQAFVFTESTVFCGAICHQIMEPEYTAYQHSPHARVACVECHIGEGAEWYARSKVSGLRQVYRTLLDSYELPIEVPIRNLRPARETCEECHWPEVYEGSLEVVNWHFWKNEENTPSKYHIMMHVAGARRETGEAEGIHWHISRKEIVRYWPSDRQRLEIPWVEVTYADGTKRVYTSDDAPSETPPEDEIRTMDCIDCHNRPSHIYRRPSEMVNTAMALGTLDYHMPHIKERSIELLDAEYESHEAAVEQIAASLRQTYPESADSKIKPATVEQAIETLSDIYLRSHFPEQGVNWKTYPDHIGHRSFPGCFRCHNDEHESEDGQTISMDCNLCHDFVFQAHGEEAFGQVTYRSAPFEHPGEDMEDIWQGFLCTDCHAPS